MSTKTPEEIEAMEQEVRAYREQQQREAAAAQREAAQPLIELVESDAFKALEEAIPTLEGLQVNNLRPHVDAIRHGLFGLRQTVDLLPAAPAE